MLQSNTLTMVSSTFENNNSQIRDLVRVRLYEITRIHKSYLVRVGLYEINRLHNSYFGSMSES